MSGRLLRSVVFLAVAVLAATAVEAKVGKTRDQAPKVRERGALSIVLSWLTASVGLPGVSEVGPSQPADGTDAGWQMDPNGTPKPAPQ